MERHHMVGYIGGYIVLFNQGRVTEVWPLFTGWSLYGGGLEHRFDSISIIKHVLL